MPKDKEIKLLCMYHYWGISGVCGGTCSRYTHDRTYKDDIKPADRSTWENGPPHDRKVARGDRKQPTTSRRDFDDRVKQQQTLVANMDDNASVISQARSTKSDSSSTPEFAKLQSRVSSLSSDISSINSGLRTLLAHSPAPARKAAHDDDAGNEFGWDP